jgi:hypothetical protein
MTGFVHGLCFIDPNGLIQVTHGVDVLVDSNYQVQGFLGPQTRIPKPAMKGATYAIAECLFQKYGVIGYVTVEYQAHWDVLADSPKLYALGVKFGLTSSFLGPGVTSVAGKGSSPFGQEPPRSLLCDADSPQAKCFVYIPYAHHKPLSTSRDDSFLKFCKMRGIGFDEESRTGTLFFHIDSIVGMSDKIL